MRDTADLTMQDYKNALVAAAEATMRLEQARASGDEDVAQAEREADEALQLCEAIRAQIGNPRF